jgi:membrane protein
VNFKNLLGNRWLKLFSDTLQNWVEDKALRLSAALAYYSVFSIAPILIIAMGIAGLVCGTEAVEGQLKEQLQAIVGSQAAGAVQSMVKSAAKPEQGWVATVTGFVVVLIGASGFFGQLKDALNTIWEVKPKEGLHIGDLVRERLLSFGMVLVIAFLLLTSLMLSTAIAALNQYLGSIAGISAEVWAVVAFFVSLGLVTVLFALIFKILPDAKVRWRNVWVGAVVTALLFEMGKFGLSYYLGRESTASSYGTAASVVLLLLWVYYASCILLFGAEFTQVYSRWDTGRAECAENAEPVLPEERAQQGLPVKQPSSPPVGVVKAGRKPRSLGVSLMAAVAGFLLGYLLRGGREGRPLKRGR